MWGPCSPTITAKSILIKNTSEGAAHKKCKEIGRQRKKDKVGNERDTVAEEERQRCETDR